MGTNLLDPETVLANEAFPKGSPRPDSFSHPASVETQEGRPACVVTPFLSSGDLENWGARSIKKPLLNFQREAFHEGMNRSMGLKDLRYF